MIHSFETMGTVASIAPPSHQKELEAIFANFDETFSLYRSSSDLSRVADGSLTLTDSSEVVRNAYALALEWRALTNGVFTPHRPDGVIDLSGVVKALAIEAAGRVLEAEHNWVLNVGGDVLTSARATTVGIVDPLDRRRLLTSLTLAPGRRAVATSGIAERGEHIWGDSRFAQATVVANDIVTADVLATTIVAGGVESLNHTTSHWDVDVLAIDRAGNLFATPGISAAIGRAAA